MRMSLDIKRKFSASSDRVKCIDQHLTEPWILCSLYNGRVVIYNTQNEAVVKEWEVTEYPVRSAKFICRKQWVICGADDVYLRVFNYNTTEEIKKWEAHVDYIRALAVHPTLPYVISGSDDVTIKLWDWEKNWQCIRVFEGHEHYVMSLCFNPKDTNTFASASLDKTIKVWNLASSHPNFTLEGKDGHTKGVNCISYYLGGEKPYLVSGSDDKTVKVWDYQTKACVQTIQGHLQYVSSVLYHPEMPLLMSSSEDGTVRIYNSNTYGLVKQLSYGMERCWAISIRVGSNLVALGYDDGVTVVKIGRDSPAASMDETGKIIFAKQNDVMIANIRTAIDSGSVVDGERIQLARKEMGHSECYPQSIKHSPNGRLCSVLGDGEYTIYVVGATWRNKAFGDASEFVWGRGKGQYAIKEKSLDPKIRIYLDFKEVVSFKPEFTPEGIFGDGPLLAVKGRDVVAFYDWDKGTFITQIEGITSKEIYWSESGDNIIISSDNSFYKLKYNKDLVGGLLENQNDIPEEGIEEAFFDYEEIPEKIKSGVWAKDSFIFTSTGNKLNFCVGNLVECICHLEKPLFLLGYLPRFGRVFLMDKALSVISYTMDYSVLEYQTAVLNKDYEVASQILPQIKEKDLPRVALFLESQGHKKQALKITTDMDHKFELAISLGALDIAAGIANQLGENDSEHKWKQIADLALSVWDFELAEKAMLNSNDLSGLLLLYSSLGNAPGMEKLGVMAIEKGSYNIAFICLLLLGRVNSCIDLLVKANRVQEAAFMSLSYAPSRVPEILNTWKTNLNKTNAKIAKSLANPVEYPNLFTLYEESVLAELQFRKQDSTLDDLPSAFEYLNKINDIDRDLIQEFQELGLNVQNEQEEEQEQGNGSQENQKTEEIKEEIANEEESKEEKTIKEETSGEAILI